MRRGDSLSDAGGEDQAYWPLLADPTAPAPLPTADASPVGVVEDYHGTLPADLRALDEHLREVALAEVPIAGNGRDAVCQGTDVLLITSERPWSNDCCTVRWQRLRRRRGKSL